MRRPVIIQPAWLCSSCGYKMDACTPVDGKAKPNRNSIAFCLNCGALYLWRDARWQPPTPAERAAFSAADKDEIARIERSRRQVVLQDLSRRDPRA